MAGQNSGVGTIFCFLARDFDRFERQKIARTSPATYYVCKAVAHAKNALAFTQFSSRSTNNGRGRKWSECNNNNRPTLVGCTQMSHTYLSNPVNDALISRASGAALRHESFTHAAEAVGVDHTEFLLSRRRERHEVAWNCDTIRPSLCGTRFVRNTPPNRPPFCE